MSDSGDEDAGAKGEKKNMLYKIKALKRRTVHAVAKAAGKAEQTKDPEFDALHDRFEEVLNSQMLCAHLLLFVRCRTLMLCTFPVYHH